jgi:plasmid stability protein
MAQIIVRGLDETVKERLKRRAAKHGRSMEEEVRAILRSAARDSGRPAPALGTRMAARFADAGLTAELPELRGQTIRPVDFSK